MSQSLCGASHRVFLVPCHKVFVVPCHKVFVVLLHRVFVVSCHRVFVVPCDMAPQRLCDMAPQQLCDMTPQRLCDMALQRLCDITPYVTEASGICASRTHNNVLYTHNDSGDYSHRIYAINATSGECGRSFEDMCCQIIINSYLD